MQEELLRSNEFLEPAYTRKVNRGKGVVKMSVGLEIRNSQCVEHRKLDIITIRREKEKSLIFEVTVPGDKHIMKEKEKMDRLRSPICSRFVSHT